MGEFNIAEEKLQGEIIYNKKYGAIWLKIGREVQGLFGNSYSSTSLITGRLHSGASVSLFHNVCTKNHTTAGYQELLFRSDFIIFGHTQNAYDQLICVLENGLRWSILSQLDTSDFESIKFKNIEGYVYHWFSVKIKFFTILENDLLNKPRKEVSRIVERLAVEIESEEKRQFSFFVQVRDKILSLISFGIKDNVNINSQYLVNFDDYHMLGKYKNYGKQTFISTEPYYDTCNTAQFKYNFTLEHLSDTEDIKDSLVKLEPILNLYLSLFKYPYMPAEMIFLNVVQALETFHSRFFYNDKKEEYVKSVNTRFSDFTIFDKLKKLLLSDTQMDKNCSYIILVSRLNDLLVGECNGLFSDFYITDNTYAQRIADTRHYYTHYSKSKEVKAFKDDELLDAIYILRLLLEYYICQVLKIDIEEATRQELSTYRMQKSHKQYME